MDSPEQPASPDPIQVEDTDELIQRRRITSVLDARDAVLEQRENALELLALGRVGEQMAARMVKEAVSSYILESENKIKDLIPVKHMGGNIDPEAVDTAEIESPTEEIAAVTWFMAPLGSVNAPAAERSVEVNGLQNFMSMRDPVTFTYEEETTHPVRGRQTERVEEQAYIPMDVSMEAYRQLNTFWSRVGMDTAIEQAGLPEERKFNSRENGRKVPVDESPNL